MNKLATCLVIQYVNKQSWYHDSSDEAFLGDFGIAKKVDNGPNTPLTAIGTPGFSAPEVITKAYTTSVDIWSYGSTLHLVATCRCMHIAFPSYMFHAHCSSQGFKCKSRAGLPHLSSDGLGMTWPWFAGLGRHSGFGLLGLGSVCTLLSVPCYCRW